MSSTLVIRADSDVRIGTGHVMRCMALAQAWQDAGGRVLHVGRIAAPSLADRLARERIESTVIESESGSGADAAFTAAFARGCEAEWIVADGYQFRRDYQRALADGCARVLVVDDFAHASEYVADVVLDQNLGASESIYAQRSATTRLLLGPQFSLLRREFARWRDWRRMIAPVGFRVLVTLGGSDPDNQTFKVIEALKRVKTKGLEAVIVAGGGNPHREQLASAVKEAGANFRLIVDATDLDAHMAWADLAVAASGSTSWERALLGLPSLVVVLAENQKRIAAALDETECAINLGCAHELGVHVLAEQIESLLGNRNRRTRLAECSRRLVDGRGAERVVEALIQLKTQPHAHYLFRE